MFQRMSVTAARELIQERAPIILDVRDGRSFDLGRLPGAIHLNNQTLLNLLRREPRTRPLLIYCYHGNTSQDHAQLLSSSGFKEVYSLDGGFDGWLAAAG